jgi:hypothetical protein
MQLVESCVRMFLHTCVRKRTYKKVSTERIPVYIRTGINGKKLFSFLTKKFPKGKMCKKTENS